MSTVMPNATDQSKLDQSKLVRLARQCVRTDLLLGLDRVPCRRPPATLPADASQGHLPTEVRKEVTTPSSSATGGGAWTEPAPTLLPGLPERPAQRGRAVEPTQEGTSQGGSATSLPSTRAIPTLAHCRDVRSLVTLQERAAALQALREEHDQTCPHCTTATYHTQTVFGEGNPIARIMFVGEAPGETEDQLGRPFVGKAGQKLDEMIRAMKFQREDVYIANVLKSRPPENRTPLQHEVDACGPYLVEQIRIIRPTVIVTLGGPATKLLLATELGITRLRGIWATFRFPLGESPETSGEGQAEIPVMPTFHPAYLLRNYTAETRRQVWSDLQSVLARLHESAAAS